MATIEQLEECRRDVIDLLAREGVPDPDWVEFGETCIRVFWAEKKVVLVVSIDDPPYWATADDESDSEPV